MHLRHSGLIATTFLLSTVVHTKIRSVFSPHLFMSHVACQCYLIPKSVSSSSPYQQKSFTRKSSLIASFTTTKSHSLNLLEIRTEISLYSNNYKDLIIITHHCSKSHYPFLVFRVMPTGGSQKRVACVSADCLYSSGGWSKRSFGAK